MSCLAALFLSGKADPDRGLLFPLLFFPFPCPACPCWPGFLLKETKSNKHQAGDWDRQCRHKDTTSERPRKLTNSQSLNRAGSLQGTPKICGFSNNGEKDGKNSSHRKFAELGHGEKQCSRTPGSQRTVQFEMTKQPARKEPAKEITSAADSHN